MPLDPVRIIGGGLAGTEAALQLARHGVPVHLYEMRPLRKTAAHRTEQLAELVCSNSFKSLSLATAPGILKAEMELLGSAAIAAAREASVAAGEALAVDRDIFAARMTAMVAAEPLIELRRAEVTSLHAADHGAPLTIVATGPLTSPELAAELARISGEEQFYFYDAISPVVRTESIDFTTAFYGNRHDKVTRALAGGDSDIGADSGDYINCPLNKEEYYEFISAVQAAETLETKDFERLKVFEGCMPIEEMVARGPDTLRFGPMRPIGLTDPRTGRWPYAVVQLRAENRERSAYNMVGFQTKMKYGEQVRVFRSIPGLQGADFYRLGSMHRNAFINAPKVLHQDLSLRAAPDIFLAGQITGVEGYMESAAIGILCGLSVLERLRGGTFTDPPAGTAFAALLSHLRNEHSPDFQPMGINFGLFRDEDFAAELAKLRAANGGRRKLPKKPKRETMGAAACARMRDFAGQLRRAAPDSAGGGNVTFAASAKAAVDDQAPAGP